MDLRTITRKPVVAALILIALLAGAAFAADSIKGQVLGEGAPIAKSTVSLWEASAGAPKQLAQTKTNDDGRFAVRVKGAHSDAVLYLVANGGVPKASKADSDNPAIALLLVVGSNPPASVTINELTTVASAFTNARFINGDTISGNPLGLRIAAGNVPNLVDPATGGCVALRCSRRYRMERLPGRKVGGPLRQAVCDGRTHHRTVASQGDLGGPGPTL